MRTAHKRAIGRSRLTAQTALATVALSAAAVAQAYESPVHVFSIEDVQGDFDGSTYGAGGAAQDLEIICGLSQGIACPVDIQPITDKQGVTLYPVDSEFGFDVIDFIGAAAKTRDGDYGEGFVGNIIENGQVVGIKVSNAATATYKVKPPLGTWCQGLGGTAVKCSTEHYTVMEHVLSCHEVVPYLFADPDSGDQAVLTLPDGSASFACAGAELNDNLDILINGEPEGPLLSDPSQINPNDNTSVLDDIAVSSDYSVTLKDDGKPLYRWGSLIKRPNDIRLYARLALPDEWKDRDPATGEPANDFTVTKAHLIVTHWITNNPNDQLRPEDLENEAATGRKPSYRMEEGTGVWKSTKPCYEGDGDLIDTEEGSADPTFLGTGTVLKNRPFADPNLAGDNPPLPLSSDLEQGFTNAFYTTTDRDPFEWSYDADPDPQVQEFVGSTSPDDTLGELVSGPRWRLRANKFGQDIPGLEIPLVECSPPPFSNDNIKYEVGTPVTTIINLLDWNNDGESSPLATSRNWVDVNSNAFVTATKEVNGVPVTANGLPMTADFDLAVYIKGDRKPTSLFSARLEIEYEGEAPQPSADFDVTLTAFDVPARVTLGTTAQISVTVTNNGPAAASGAVSVTGETNRGETVGPFAGDFVNLADDSATTLTFDWTASDSKPGNIRWSAEVTAAGDTNAANDTATASTKVRRH